MENDSSIAYLKQQLDEGTTHLINMAKGLEFPWNPDLDDPRALHNMYARNLVTCYVSKYADLSIGILYAIDSDNFLTYALCGRALIETTAILHYYMTKEYKPILDQPELGVDEMQRLIEIDDRHLRGANFDWESFIYENYSKLKSDAVSKLEGGAGKQKNVRDLDQLPRQVRIGKCIRSWAHETPEVLVAYELFCDLVHPNVGTTFLVASSGAGSLYFSRFRGEPVGRMILEQSFPVLLSLAHRPMPSLLAALMMSIWQDDELATH